MESFFYASRLGIFNCRSSFTSEFTTMKFPFKVWLTTILVAPLLAVFILGIRFQNFEYAMPIILVAMAYGCLFSLPALLIYWFVYRKLLTRQLKTISSRLILSIVGMISVYISFCLFNIQFLSFSSFDVMIWPHTYAAVLIVATFLIHFESGKVSSEMPDDPVTTE